MRRWWTGIGCAAIAMALVACGGDEGNGGTAGGGSGGGGVSEASMATPRGSIAYQMKLLASGDVEAFRACFTPRLRDRITTEAMAEGAAEAGSMTLDDVFASMEEGEWQGKKTAKVKMKNGRTLTTLVLTDGKWLADTVWFR